MIQWYRAVEGMWDTGTHRGKKWDSDLGQQRTCRTQPPRQLPPPFQPSQKSAQFAGEVCTWHSPTAVAAGFKAHFSFGLSAKPDSFHMQFSYRHYTEEVSLPAQPRAGVKCNSAEEEWLWQYPCDVQALGLESLRFFPLISIKQCQI